MFKPPICFVIIGSRPPCILWMPRVFRKPWGYIETQVCRLASGLGLMSGSWSHWRDTTVLLSCIVKIQHLFGQFNHFRKDKFEKTVIVQKWSPPALCTGSGRYAGVLYWDILFKECPELGMVHPLAASPSGCYWVLPSTTTILYRLTCEIPSTNQASASYTGNHPVQPQSSTGYTGSHPVQQQSSIDSEHCPIQQQSSIGVHWKLPSTMTVFNWWKLSWNFLVKPLSSTGHTGSSPDNHILLLVYTGSCSV